VGKAACERHIAELPGPPQPTQGAVWAGSKISHACLDTPICGLNT